MNGHHPCFGDNTRDQDPAYALLLPDSAKDSEEDPHPPLRKQGNELPFEYIYTRERQEYVRRYRDLKGASRKGLSI